MRLVRVFIEAEAGSDLRNAYDETTLEPLGSRRLSAAHPFAYGFVVGTRTDDGDAVDCFLLTSRPVRVGQLVEAEPVGLLEQFENGVPDHKLLAVPADAPETPDADVRDTLQTFILRVFQDHPRVKVEVGRLLGAEVAMAHVESHRTSPIDAADGPER